MAIFEGFAYEPRFRPSAIQERLVEAGRLGRKTREGFYWYAEDGRRLGVAGAFAAEPDPLDPPGPTRRALPDGRPESAATDIDPTVERIVLAVILEAYRALGDLAAEADDIDLALRLGAGHPIGPFDGRPPSADPPPYSPRSTGCVATDHGSSRRPRSSRRLADVADQPGQRIRTTCRIMQRTRQGPPCRRGRLEIP